FERAHCGFDGVERTATAAERAPARQRGGRDTLAELVESLARLGAGATVDDDRGDTVVDIARWRHEHHRVTIRPDCKTEARSTVPRLASFAVAAVPGWWPIARPSPPSRLRAMPASSTGPARCPASAIHARDCSWWDSPPPRTAAIAPDAFSPAI